MESGVQTHQIALPITISATTAAPILLWRVPFKCKLAAIWLAVQAAIAASDTDYWTIAVINRAAAGGGTTALIVTTTTKAASLNGLAAYVDKALTLTATAADLILQEGDIVTLTLTKAASGADWVMPLVYFEFYGTAAAA
jgi:hypothetical protein